MPQITAPFIIELEHEAATTRRLLERVPDGKFDWQPHPTSKKLGPLAAHVAETSGFFAGVLANDNFDMAELKYSPPEAHSTADLLAQHEQSMMTSKQFLSDLSDERAMTVWNFKAAGKVLFAAPRIVLVRSLMFSHWIHHRGQLSVYLRMLSVPIPSIYGPSGDENPFAP
jgi:uncharacterized damage-inducible protein DinB